MARKNKYSIGNLPILLIIIGLSGSIILTTCGPGVVELDPEIEKITTYRFGESRENLTIVADRVRTSYGNSEERLRLEKQFAQILRSDEATLECKDFICRQLWVIGTKVSIPALAKMLTDDKTSDMARYALEQNPAPAAGKALRKALKKTEGTVLIGIINSLGERRDEKSVKALKKLLLQQDKEIASAAEASLKKINIE